jgi:RNA polymerase sigma-70 factor (ECF subfamily)
MPGETDEQDRADMAQLVSGHDKALNDLMGRHARPLYHYLIRVLQNEAEAADLAEESFVRIYQHRARYRPTNRFSTWLYTIATNLARDLQRRRLRHPQVSLETPIADSGAGLGETLAEPRPDPSERLEASERSEAVRHAVAALPEELRLPLLLSEYEDKSHAEIGTILGCSPKAVEMRLYRARQQLRSSLKGLMGAS